jgi:hypothetical protein
MVLPPAGFPAASALPEIRQIYEEARLGSHGLLLTFAAATGSSRPAAPGARAAAGVASGSIHS